MTTTHEEPITARATILSFPRKRGRPKISRPRIDVGTPELILKRMMGVTAEALDLCLERGIITHEQHWCGIHLRWLYTLRHGAPSVRAIDPTHLGGCESKVDDPQWREAREKEYHDAMKKLHRVKQAQPLIDLCIYNQRPNFLSLNHQVTKARADEVSELMAGLRQGLDILVEEWRRNGTGK